MSDALIQPETGRGYDKRSWLEEADRHLRSSQFLRRIKKRRRTSFRNSADDSKRSDHVFAMDATTHSSMLLIGYAVDLFLKAGLTHVYMGCPTSLFKREIKHRYSHNLLKLAKNIECPSFSTNCVRLNWLEKIIRSQGRYPNVDNNKAEAIKLQNQRALQVWDDGKCEDFCNLATSIRKHVIRIDQDVDNPMVYAQRRIHRDGYCAFRYGGNLSPRVTVKFS